MEKDFEDEEIKSGLLYKKENRFGVAKKWSEKWFVLTSKNLLWYNTKKDRASKKRSKGVIPLEKVSIKLGGENDSILLDAPKGLRCCFSVFQTDGSYISLCAQGEEDMGFWMDVLNSAASGRKDLTKETVAIQEELRKTGVQEIPPEALTFNEEVIGSGASGIVKRGLWLKSTEVAVKVLKNVPEFTDRRDLLSFYKEIETLSKLRHSNIVQMYGFCKKESYLCLVTEYVRGGNLADWLEDAELDLYLQIKLALNITRGMVYLHNQNVIHRDLKPANILIESWDEGKVKVCDFGISRVVKKQESEKSGDPLGSPQYAAPELNSDVAHDNKVDVFSFAIILWEIALRQTPWPELKFGSQFAERYQKKERPKIPPDNAFKSLIERCWAHVPSERPSFVQIYESLEGIEKEGQGGNKPIQQRVKSFTGGGPQNQGQPGPQRSQSTLSLGYKDQSPTKPLPNPSANGLKLPAKGKSATLSPNSLRHTNSNTSLLNSNGYETDNGRTKSPYGMTGSPSPPTQHNKSNAPPNPKTAAEAAIWKVFAKSPTETWENFALAFRNALATDVSSVQKLKFVFEKDGMVERQTWETFLIWFSPLDVSEIYQTSGGSNASKGGYEIDHILAVCHPAWFHGFLSSADAQKALKGKPDGSFLFRFSTTNPGCYALTVAYSNTVGHWRISCEKKPFEVPVFLIDGRSYTSLEAIIQTHRFNREPLNIKSPKPGQATSCFLGSYHPRDEGDTNDQYYQNVQ